MPAGISAGDTAPQGAPPPFYYCKATGQQSFWLPANALCVIDEFDVFIEPAREEPPRSVSLSDSLGTSGGADTSADGVVVALADAQSPDGALALGPTPEQAARLAEERRERELAGLT